MITGAVNRYREATVRLIVRGSDEREREVEAVLDTGFNGSLTLPLSIIEDLALRWRTQAPVILADGREEELADYSAVVVWDGNPRGILVQAADAEPLLGMNLLYGYDLRIEVVEGGSVTIELLS